MTGNMTILTHFSTGTIVLLAGALSVSWANAMQQSDGLMNDILGPTGALALSIAALGFIVKYLLRQQKKLEESVDARIKDKDDIIAQKEKDIEYLRSLINK